MSTYAWILFVVFQLWTTDARQRRYAAANDQIVFPGPVKKVPPLEFPDKIDLPVECYNKTYCHIRPKNYPQNIFDDMFRGKKIPSQPELVLTEHGVANRFQDESDDGCKAQITFEPIYVVHTEETGWRAVVQAPKYNFVQKIRLEKCVNEEASCFSRFPKVPDYTTFCKQKYGVWEVLVSDQNGGTQPVKTELPICCSCYYKQTEKH